MSNTQTTDNATHCTSARDVFDSFESSFRDENVIPFELEMVWLEKAIGRFSVELEPLNFDRETLLFDKQLDRYIIDTLGAMMKQSYQEREVSRVNKRASIVTKDISIDGSNGLKTAAKNELDYDISKAEYMIAFQKETSYV